jgi:hypothetical protein
VVVAGVSGVRHLRKMVTQLVSQRGDEDRVVQLRPGEYDYQ